MQTATSELARLVLRFGSVNALAEKLSEALGEGAPRIYPNRIHGLLTNDESRGVNSATLAALEAAIAAVDEPTDWAMDPKAVQRAVEMFPADDPRRLQRVADEFGVPIGVVQGVAAETGVTTTTVAGAEPHHQPIKPDWSWQEVAVKQSLEGLRLSTGRKVGLVLPTGAGKTTVALRVALDWLNDNSAMVLWVTHRHHLRRQARRTLQALIRATDLSAEQAAALFERVQFTMAHDLTETVGKLSETSLIIVDEAHHAAAPSYRPVVEQGDLPVLFLTATPNRADALPIGIDEIAYTTSYRQLIERGCVIEPIFDPPEEMPTLDWSSPAGLHELADYLLDRTESDFSKPLVAVSLQANAESLYKALQDQLDQRQSHPLTAEDIGYVHGGSNSRGLADSGEFLDEFSAKPAGILVATSQLVGEGFDDPSLDAAVITYPSSSIGHLMQVAGRALRWTPNKVTAHIIQVRRSPLEYHFEQRWLYQDISDELRPDLLDYAYASADDLAAKVQRLLERHNVSHSIRQRITVELSEVEPGDRVNILLSGLNYYGPVDGFDTDAPWNAVLVHPRERDRFLRIFNDVSGYVEDIKDVRAYLGAQLRQDLSAGSLWKSYGVMIAAMEFARREIHNTPYHGDDSRNYTIGRATSWLKYVTFEFRPTVPIDLDTLLADAYNRDELLSAYIARPGHWSVALRLEIPVFGSQGFLLDEGQGEWLLREHEQLVEQLQKTERSARLDALSAWRSGLAESPIPVRILDHLHQLLRSERLDRHLLRLDRQRVDNT
ncbi:hypothetical protein BST16_06650 [Mycobacterium asiaticum DSM 44297]|nr:hypothetical protein BST16_06650 [Mycobacterium asiaticum DSM 44297]